MGHFGVTTGVVGDGTVCVGCEGDTERRKHTHGCDTDTVKTEHEFVSTTGTDECKNDRDDNGCERSPGTFHTFSHTGDDDGRGPGFCLLGDFLSRLVFVAGVVLGGFTDDNTGKETGDNARGDTVPGDTIDILEQPPADGVRGTSDHHAAAVDALTERRHQLTHRCAFLRTHHVNTENRKHDTDTREHHRNRQQLHGVFRGFDRIHR